MSDQQSGKKEWEIQLKKKHLNRFLKTVTEGPNQRVHDKIQELTYLPAPKDKARLTEYYTRKESERKISMKKKKCKDIHGEKWRQDLIHSLASAIPVPVLAGLGALAITISIDFATFSPPEDSTEHALRSVFAEEKASEVWDQIDECLKRYIMNINNRDELVSDIKRIECLLSAALTKLKNSMMRNRNMLNQALRAWVNRAAFHVQMLIHLERLKDIKSCDPVGRLISTYQRDLYLLFEKHKEVIKGKCSFKKEFFNNYLVDENLKKHKMSGNKYDLYFEAYYHHRYGKQERKIQQYFLKVKELLELLVHLTDSFEVKDQLGGGLSPEHPVTRSFKRKRKRHCWFKRRRCFSQ